MSISRRSLSPGTVAVGAWAVEASRGSCCTRDSLASAVADDLASFKRQHGARSKGRQELVMFALLQTTQRLRPCSRGSLLWKLA